MSTITPRILYDAFLELTGGEDPGPVVTYNLMTMAKDQIEDDLNLHILLSVDSTKTANPGDTYLTMKDLPEDWRKTLKIVVGVIPYYPVRFVQREAFRSNARKYYIDAKNAQYALMGAVAAVTAINHYYLCTTPIVSEENEEDPAAIAWPDRFKALIPYKMALIFQSTSQGDAISFRLAQSAETAYENIRDSFIAWDHDLKLQDMNNQGGYADDVADGDQPIDVGRL